MQVFGKQWFIKYHDWLLKLANTSYGRYVMGIDTDKVICRLTPTSYSVIEGMDLDSKLVHIKTRITGRPLIARRLANNLGWLWKAMHALDSLILDRQQLVPNFGFNTLSTFESSTGTGPGNVDHTCARTVIPDGELWGTISTGSGTDVDATDNYVQTMLASNAITNMYQYMERGFMQFDTDTPILRAGTLISANLEAYLVGVQGPTVFWTGSDQGLCLRACSGTPSGTASVTDFQKVDSQSRISAELLYSAMSTTSYNTFSINQSGWTDWLNTTGYSMLAIMFVEDQPGWIPGGNSPTWASDTNCRYQFEAADAAGTNEAYLEVTTLGILKVNVGDVWKDSIQMQINIGDAWKNVLEMKINVGDVWKVIF